MNGNQVVKASDTEIMNKKLDVRICTMAVFKKIFMQYSGANARPDSRCSFVFFSFKSRKDYHVFFREMSGEHEPTNFTLVTRRANHDIE